MSAGIYHLLIEQGAYFERLFTYKDDDGDPIDLTGYEADLQIRKRYNATTADMTISTVLGGITLGSADGTIRIILTDDQTAMLTRDGFYDLRLTPPSLQSVRILEGEVRLSLSVTR